MPSKGEAIREKYEATCKGYDELYRAEQFEKYFVALRRVPPRGVVLDAGCGTGLLIEFLKLNGALGSIAGLVCVDYSGCMLSISAYRSQVLYRGRCLHVLGNIERLPLPDKAFDTVYSFTVLDLVDNLRGAVAELQRVSRGPIVVSMLKKLPYKDMLIDAGARLLGVTSKDVILRVDGIEVSRIGEEKKDSGGA